MIEQRIASALKERNTFSGTVSSDDLGAILTKVLGTIVTEQKVGGMDVPIQHHVSEMGVHIQRGKAHVACAMQVRSPINATLRFRYTLENHPSKQKLCLHNNHVEIDEITRPFDVTAKIALKVMDVRQIVMQQLRNPNAVIRRVLPVHLRQQGFAGEIHCIGLEILPDDTIAITVNGDDRAVH